MKDPQGNVDDLFVHQEPTASGKGDGGTYLYYLRNDLTHNGTYDLGTDRVYRPDCVTKPGTNCADYSDVSLGWANISQITPIGSINAALAPSDKATDATGVLVVENGNLWYYPRATASPATPTVTSPTSANPPNWPPAAGTTTTS